MTILGLCFDGSAHGVATHHNPVLVLISYLIAVFASFTALEMAERHRNAAGWSRALWHIGGAVALGGGVWSMHFIAMLAFKLPMKDAYDPVLTADSGVIAIAAVAVGLQVFNRPMTVQRLAMAGLLVGLGVAAMHYCGMSALRLPAQVYYDPGLFALSIAIAVAAATAALWLAYTLRSTWQRGLAALVMALAIWGMHFTGMAATTIVAGPASLLTPKGLVQGEALDVVVVAGVCVIFVLGLVCTFADRRREQRALLEAERLRALNAELAERTEALTRALADVDEARRAEAATKAKSDLLSSMSHELRTPLNAVIGFAQVLQMNRVREPLTASQDQAVSHILESGLHLLAQIEAMLDFANLDASGASLKLEAIDLADFLGCVGGAFTAESERGGVRLSCDCDRGDGRRVLADRGRLDQILNSIVSNAVRYNRPGGEVRVSVAARGDMVAITVLDTGCGIPAAMLPNLFQPFNRLGREGGSIMGVGMGLAVAKRLAEAMGGSLDVASVEGEGSAVTVTLPSAARSASEERRVA